MTPEEAQERVDHIQSISGDPEAAHSNEDDLHVDFIKAVRMKEFQSLDHAARVAEIVLETDEIAFPRWCA